MDKRTLLNKLALFAKGVKTKGKLRAIAVSLLSFVILTFALMFLYVKYSDRKAVSYIGDLSVDNPVVRQTAIRKIAAAKDTAKLTNRIALTFYSDAEVRLLIVKKSVDCLRSQDADTVEATLKMLGKLQDKNAVPYLTQLLEENKKLDKDLVVAALEALGRIQAPEAVQAISPFLSAEDQSVRITSIWALGNIGDKKAISLLLPLLQEKDKYIRYQTAVALRRIG